MAFIVLFTMVNCRKKYKPYIKECTQDDCERGYGVRSRCVPDNDRLQKNAKNKKLQYGEETMCCGSQHFGKCWKGSSKATCYDEQGDDGTICCHFCWTANKGNNRGR